MVLIGMGLESDRSVDQKQARAKALISEAELFLHNLSQCMRHAILSILRGPHYYVNHL